jgi:uncharacterized protein YkwD
MSFLRSFTAVAALGLASTFAASLPSASSATLSSDAAGRTVATAAHYAAEGTFTGAINTKSRAAVNRAYRSRYAPNLSTSIGWTGSVSGCHAGHTSHRAKRATLESINFVRAMGGLAPVKFSKVLSARAQKAALIMAANNALSHYPPRSWKCWSRVGANAAGHSNIALAYPKITAGGLVSQYMDDYGDSNTFVGHRRWIMYPPSVKMGSGSTATSNALWVLGPTRDSRPNPTWVSWPTAGYFPAPLEPDGRWSLSAGLSGTNFSHARVSVRTAGGQARSVHVYPVAVGYGKDTLVWEVNNIGTSGTYKVTVRGIKQPGRAHPFAHTYTVRLFTPGSAR